MKIIAVVVVVAIGMYVIVENLKRSAYKRLVTYLQEGKLEEFHKEIDSQSIKFLFPKISVLDMKLNAAIVEQNKKQTIAYLEQICAMPLPNSQKEIYYMKAFNFFVGISDKKNCKLYLDKINQLPNERLKQEANRVYNIYILKNDKYLKDLLEELEEMEDSQKGVNEFLISIIYKNMKDFEKAEYYEELSKEHFALVDEMTSKKLNKQE
ncbi:MAG: hypothetical protein Q4C49_05425 [Bacillota bacterium]|nr:hypothetical protein [Bacillota bacterium]